MSFLKNIFGKRDNGEEFTEGDIFYTSDDHKFHIHKLLKFDKDYNTYHILSYAPVLVLPKIETFDELEVLIYHAPIDKNGFANAKLLAKKE